MDPNQGITQKRTPKAYEDIHQNYQTSSGNFSPADQDGADRKQSTDESHEESKSEAFVAEDEIVDTHPELLVKQKRRSMPKNITEFTEKIKWYDEQEIAQKAELSKAKKAKNKKEEKRLNNSISAIKDRKKKAMEQDVEQSIPGIMKKRTKKLLAKLGKNDIFQLLLKAKAFDVE